MDLPFPPAISRSMCLEDLDGFKDRYATLIEYVDGEGVVIILCGREIVFKS